MVEIRALGPLEAWAGGERVPLGGPKQLAVLALLIAGRGRPVTDDSLIDGVWGDDAGPGARATLQTYVSNLRHALGERAIVREGDAYRLDVDRRHVDVWHFEAAVEAARDALPAHPEDAARQLRGALDLWRGAPYGGAQDCERLDEDSRELEALRLAALEDRLEAELTAGGGSALLGELSSLARRHPLREGLQGLQMLALYRAGRQGDALEVYERTRRLLADELGVDVSPHLRDLHQRILEQDPDLLVDEQAASDQPVAPPSGQVTFVFTDIEGSTRLFHELGPDYPEALQRHRRILREAWDDHGGYEATVEGDGSLVAFGSAADAVRAAIAAQRALAAEAWPQGVELRVRMGLHTGLASPRRGNYISLTVHEAARVMAAAQGTQILVSEATAERLTDLSEFELHPRGRFRLRGFDQPVRLHEIRAPGLPEVSGPVRATPADRHNLVRQPTETLGREELIADVTETVSAGRIVTLTGPGGVGKTRVASEVGIRIADDWPDGVWFVDLATVGEPELVAAAIADAAAAPTRPGGERQDDLIGHLTGRRSVLILDNCEHVLAACRALLGPLFHACPDVAVLATSRESLHWKGETVRPVAPLDLPPAGAGEPGTVRGASACQLFEQRGANIRPGFAIDDDNAAAIGEICRQLDGLPLLIELVAALLAFQSPTELRGALAEHVTILQRTTGTEPDRHGSLDSLVGWSYRLLDEQEQTAFRRLAVFGASFSLDTATAAVTVDGIGSQLAPRLVWSLVDRSLVVADLRANETRYRLLATIRSFARGRLDEAGETGQVATALATFLLDRVGPWIPTEWTWVVEAGVELDNLRALLPLLPDGEGELAQTIACTIGRYHDATQSFREGIHELRRHADNFTVPSATRVSLLTTLGDLHLRTGDVEAATELVHAASELEAVHGAPDWDDVAVDRTRGEIARRRGDLEGAVEIARSALARELTDRGRSRMLNLLGTTLGPMGDLEAARDALTEQLEINRRLGYEASIAASHGNLAETALRLGDLEAAAHHQRACLELAVAKGSPAMTAFSLIVAARLAGESGDWDPAVRLHTRAEAMLEETGLSLYEDDRRESEELLARARAALEPPAFDSATLEGRRLSISDATGIADAVFADRDPIAQIDLSDDSVGVV